MVIGLSGIAAGTATLTAGQASAKPGESVTIPVTLGNNPGIAGLGIKIEYDSTRLTLDNQHAVTQGDALPFLSYVGVTENTYKNNPFTSLWFGAMTDRSNGTLINVTFSARLGGHGYSTGRNRFNQRSDALGRLGTRRITARTYNGSFLCGLGAVVQFYNLEYHIAPGNLPSDRSRK
jgi:hypothetical protein